MGRSTSIVLYSEVGDEEEQGARLLAGASPICRTEIYLNIE